MSRLGDEICRKIGDRESKELFPEYVEALESSEEPELSTFVTKLSKLRNGAPEGERYFLEKPDRSRALEKVLGVEQGWLAAQRQVRVLVLDPALPENAVAFLKEHEAHAVGAFACQEVSLEGLAVPAPRPAVLARIREVAERESSALVVNADGKDALYFDGAKLHWTLLEKRPRGFVLASDPELVPQPAPPPPPLFDENGEPLMPHPEFEILARREREASHSWNRDAYSRAEDQHDNTAPDCLFRVMHRHDDAREDLQALSRSISKADSTGSVASFPATLVLRWQLSLLGLEFRAVRVADQASDTVSAWFLGRGNDGELAGRVCQVLENPHRTILWSHARQILGVGPQIEQIAELLAPHHVLAQPTTLIRWREALAAWNPWRTGGHGGLAESERWKSLRRDAVRELGLSIDSTVVEWRQRVVERCFRAPTSARLATPDEAAAAHDALATLAARPWPFDTRWRAWPLRLDAASRASLAILSGHGERDGLHVLANLGAGKVLRIQVARFPSEEPVDIVSWGGDFEMDGGDVHLRLEETSDSFLEGSGLTSVRRR